MTLEDWRKQQEILSWSVTESGFVGRCRYVAGLDISWLNETDGKDDCKGVAAIAIFDVETSKVVYTSYERFETDIPYISGFLGFREVPHFVKLCHRAMSDGFRYDVLMVDGFGILHPVGCGSASMLGVQLDATTIGVGKTLNCGGCDQSEKPLRQYMEEKGLMSHPLTYKGKRVGMAMKKNKKAIYVSVGHKITLEQAINIVEKCQLFKIPEPIRQADLLSRAQLQSCFARA